MHSRDGWAVQIESNLSKFKVKDMAAMCNGDVDLLVQ